MTTAKLICGFICSKLLVLLACTYAVGQVASDSTAVLDTSAQAGKHSFLLLQKPLHLYLGADPVKALWNMATPGRLRVEGHMDAYYGKNIIINSTFGFANGNYSNATLSYSTNSIGADVTVCRSLFSAMGNYDLDGAFVGIGYGASYNRIGSVDYKITDVWGTTTGSLPASNMLLHWLQLSAGFMVQITPRLHAGWRVYGRSLVNGKRLSNIAPIYTAPFGTGDKVTVFAYNFFATRRLW
jgi:hypothetical protein